MTINVYSEIETEVRMVEAIYENSKGRVAVVESGRSNEFQVYIGLIQAASALSPLLFIFSNRTNQQKNQHKRCFEKHRVCRRSCDRCKAQGRIAWRIGGVQ